MKVCIIGAGAIGGFIGTRLALAGACQLSALARGATLAALQTRGWRLQQGARLLQAPAVAAGDPQQLGPQDLVIVAVKGPALPQLAAAMAPLLGPQTIVLPAMNGVPWWFGNGIAALGAAPLESVDPGGLIAQAIAPQRVLGCVVHASVASGEPGLAVHKMGQGLIIGEPDGGLSPRVAQVAELLSHAGFELTQSRAIRYDIWYKLWGNMTMNPISALTGATMDTLLDDALVRAFMSAVMVEAAQVGARIGCAVSQSPEDRHVITRRLGAVKTSMLQDVEAGRPLELDSIVAAVREIGQRVALATPAIDALLGLTRVFARERGLYRPAA